MRNSNKKAKSFASLRGGSADEAIQPDRVRFSSWVHGGEECSWLDCFVANAPRNDAKAFTIIEIIVIIFILSLVVSVTIPLITTDRKQAARISRWQDVEKETDYFFNLLNIFYDDYAQNFNTDNIIAPDEVFRYFLNYIGEGNYQIGDLNKYKYKYLNNKSISPMSSDQMQYLIERGKNTLIGYTIIKDKCDDDEPCAKLFFDVNGYLPPNKFGKDIFGFNIYKTKIEPFGKEHSFEDVAKDCSSSGSGKYCSIYYSDGGQIH